MAKPPSWNEIRANATAFASRWAGATDENAEAQTFWNEFLGMFGVDRKRVATFEARAKRTSTGGRGRIDLYWPGTLVAEHKSAGKDLDFAEAQALDYLDSIDQENFPGVVITSDFSNIRIRDLGGDNHPYTLPLNRLAAEIDRFGFIAGYKQRKFGDADEAEANIQAARLMAGLYEELSRGGYEGHDASVLMTRLLFLMFGDDTAMWEKGLFGEFVDTRTSPDGADTGPQLAFLFQILDRSEETRPANVDELLLRFPYVNGHLFTDRIDIPVFDRAMRDELVKCCNFDWSKISPAVFGSLFQAVKSKEARRALGEHYTTEQNILRALGPLFLDELHAEYAQARDHVLRLERLHDKLAAMTVMDPACGCGNFLVIAYRELRRLELKTLTRLAELRGVTQQVLDVTSLVRVRLGNFFGIEVEEWPARIAETAMFLVDQQANHELSDAFGQMPDRLPIMNAANITVGNALRLDWNDVVPADQCSIIVGNPPFVGQYTRTEEQTADLQHVWGSGYDGYLDYVTGWYIQTLRYLGDRKSRWAFVSTSSICQGEPVADLWDPIIQSGWRVRFAHRPFIWTSEAPGAANVHVVIVGFDREVGSSTLYDYENGRGMPVQKTVSRINPYLVEGPDILVRSRSSAISPGLPPVDYGSKPTDGGHLMVTADQYDAVMADPHMAKYVRPFIGARELIHGERRWCLWLEDLDPADLSASRTLRDRIDAVRVERLASRKKATRDGAATPALFDERRQPASNYLGIPIHVGESRRYFPVGYFSADVICGNHNFLAADPDGYLFGLLSSTMFITWMRMVSGRIRDDLRFSKTLTWHNFPLPSVSEGQRAAVCAAAQQIIRVRDKFDGRSLSHLYDPLAMPPDLVAAHRSLDRVVDGGFGTAPMLTDADRMKVLIDRYSELTATLFTGQVDRKSRSKK